MDGLVPAFRESVFDPALGDALMDVAELGVDSVLDFEPVKSLPLAGLLVGAARTVLHVRDRNLLVQTAGFIDAFNAGAIDEEQLRRHRDILESNPKRVEEELGRVIILLDRSVEVSKSRVLGRLYRAYVEGKLPWLQFRELSDVVDRAFVDDFQLLVQIHDGLVADTSGVEGFRAERLRSLGLLSQSMKRMVWEETTYYVACSALGDDLVRYGLSEP